MRKIRTLIIDDEPKIVRLLEQCLMEVADVEILGTGHNATEAYNLIRENHPDLVFLDISMPGQDAFELLDRFDSRKFEVVFITAFDQYALKAFDEHALSYLLKPIDIQKLHAALDRCRSILQNKDGTQESQSKDPSPEKAMISIPANYGHVLLSAEDIVRCEGDGNYTSVFTKDLKKYVVSQQIRVLEDKLTSAGFFRIHKKHLVNLSFIHSYDKGRGGNLRLSDGSEVAISYRKKSEFLQLLQNKNLPNT